MNATSNPKPTRFFLHGGGATDVSTSNKEFFSALIEGQIHPSILVIGCSVPSEKEQAMFARTSNVLTTILPGIPVALASRTTIQLEDQARSATALFFCGGSEEIYRQYMSRELLVRICSGKAVAGGSAGVNIFAMNYFSNDRMAIEKGFGILPINTICHYQSDRAARVEQLVEANAVYPAVIIQEGHFVSLMINL